MDDRLGVKAKDLLALLSERQLADLFAEHGEDANRKIAREIVYRRKKQVITTTQQLAHLIEEVKPGHRGHLHPATKVFQALRVAVNGELDSIHQVLPQAFAALTEGGRLVTISFHEGEDRIVKNFFNQEEDEGKAVHLTHKVITASEQELEENQRSRSAKLRILEKKAL
jgi:16S rRNA (cytosine1402-N4)-methyltransferase